MNTRLTFALCLCIIFGLSTTSVWAQKSKEEDVPKRPKIARQGDDYYEGKEYTKAILLYRKAYSKVKSRSDKAEISYRLG